MHLRRNVENNPSTDTLTLGSACDTECSASAKGHILSDHAQTLLPALHTQSTSIHETSRTVRESRKDHVVLRRRVTDSDSGTAEFSARAVNLPDMIELPDHGVYTSKRTRRYSSRRGRCGVRPRALCRGLNAGSYIRSCVWLFTKTYSWRHTTAEWA